MSLPKIVFLDRATLRAHIKRPSFPHHWQEYAHSTPQEALTRLANASIVISNKVALRADVLEQLPQLKMIAEAATGTDNIDLEWCRNHGIVVSNIRDYARYSVPEHVLMLILSLRRQLLAYRSDIAAGKWQKTSNFCFFDHPIQDLHGSTLGLIGRGSIGQGVAKLASAFGMRVLWGERKGIPLSQTRPGYISFSQLLAEADVLSLHCPLNTETQHLIGADELHSMKSTALLINTARGALLDADALAMALNNGDIAGAAIDVLDSEPPPSTHPLLKPELLAYHNLIITPHIAWASDAAMQMLADQLIENIEAFMRGKPQNRCA